MKRCPECRRDHYDSLLDCLDDATALLEGPAETAEAETALLSDLPSESSTRNPHIKLVTRVALPHPGN